MEQSDNQIPSSDNLPSRPRTPFTPDRPETQSEGPPTPQPQRIPLPRVQPIFTYVFLAINIIVFLAQLATDSIGMRPSLAELGWKDTARIAQGEYWRLVTPLFLHGGPAHIFFNSYALYIIGPQVERVFGHLRYVAVYLLSGIAGVIASMAFTAAPSIGASGAIFGLIGALIVYLYLNRDLFGRIGQVRLRGALQMAGINLIIGFVVPIIDNWGHIGGLVGGAAMTLMLGPLFAIEQAYDGTSRVEDRRPMGLWWAGIFVGLGALVALTVLVITIRT